MNRKHAQEIIDEEDSARAELVRRFHGYHPYTVAEALLIWAQLPDCDPRIGKVLKGLRPELSHCPEFVDE